MQVYLAQPSADKHKLCPKLTIAQPVLMFAVIYDGPVTTAREYAKPAHAIGPITVQAGEATYHELAVLTLQDADGPACTYGLTSLRYPVVLNTYNTSVIRKLYDDVDSTLQAVPELAGSVFVLESYACQAVQAVDSDTTAFPHRADRVLTTSYIGYKPDPAIDPIAQAFGERMRGYLLEASDDPARLKAYVNYAHGDEPLGAVYGWEEWRLEKLRRLKEKWDPKNRMRYYVPI
jgi:hypothetical protein